ncbi:MAG: zinc dependent phospholipase C family protein [Bacillota bacterium]
MPDVWTHLICGRQILPEVEARLGVLTEDQKKLFFLGCQGPDLFFYYNFMPWAGDKRAVVLGNRLHHERCGLFFREALKYAKARPEPKILVYITALLSHWCLDRATHPYINYISGVFSGKGPGGEKIINNHKRVEAAIDVILARKMLNVDVRRVPVHPEIDAGATLPDAVCDFYHHVLPLVHGEHYRNLEGTDFINKSYRDMVSALRLLHDPSGLKAALASLYDTVSINVSNWRYYFYRDHDGDGEEYMNGEKRPWCHPMDSGERHRESFYELFQTGVEDSLAMADLAARYVRGEADERELQRSIKNISHSTGKPDTDRRVMRHFNPVLP